MGTIKKIPASLLLFLLVVTSVTFAGEPLPPLSEWVPDTVSVTIPSDRQNPYTWLRWKRLPVFRSPGVRAIEAELVFPELKRVGGEQYYSQNKLGWAEALILPQSCYYQDTYYLDGCENWTLGIDTSAGCLVNFLPGSIRVDYHADPLPPEVTTGRYQIQTVGVEVNGRSLYSKLVGEACSVFCGVCFLKADLLLTGEDDKQICVELAKIKNPYATWEWLQAFCPSCEDAKNATPAWQNFLIDEASCVEPVVVPGTSQNVGCVKPAYSDWCAPVNPSAAQRICLSTTPRCEGYSRSTCSADGTRWEPNATCRCPCSGSDCGGTTCQPGASTCQNNVLSTCDTYGCGTTSQPCACGCSPDGKLCQPKVCTTPYCRDAGTLIKCTNGGCGTVTESCGYGCANNRCNDPPGTNPDMATGGTPPDLASPPRDFAGPPMAEICNGIDDDKNGIVDDPAGCWLTVYRFRDPATNARCYGPTNIAPPVCSGYVLETVLFSAPAAPWADGSTAERAQCSKGTDHIITTKGGGEYATLQGMGWSCNVTLGYWFATGYGPQFPVRTPFAYTCPVYRSWCTTTGGTSHIFSGQNESFFGTFTCEPPTRGEVVQNVACGKPSGC